MEPGALRQRDQPLTPDLWPLTRLSDGLSIPSGLTAVIVAWSSLDMLFGARDGRSTRSSRRSGLLAGLHQAAEGVTRAATLKLNGGIFVVCWQVVGARCHRVTAKLRLL